MKKLISLLFFSFLTSTVYADDWVRPIAHVGGSYALTHISEVLLDKATTSLSRGQCTLIGAGISLGTGLIIELTHKSSDDRKWGNLGYNALGVALAATVITIDF